MAPLSKPSDGLYRIGRCNHEGAPMFLLALLLQSAHPAPSAPPPLPPLHGGPQEMTCPVGGERFSAWRPATYSTYGERPDGRPYSYLPFPFPLPECPSNKLIVFDTFSPQEVNRLAPLIQTPDYARLVSTETTYYRAYWLVTKLGRPDADALGFLLPAIWQVTPGFMALPATSVSKAQLRRYQTEFVERVERLPANTEPRDRLWLDARAANALRQMKRFADAEAMRQKAGELLQQVTDKGGWDRYLARLQVVIARKDSSPEPLDMIPDNQVAFACDALKKKSSFDKAICARPDVVARIAEIRQSARNAK